jgi:cytochrome c peroxidase
MREIADRIIYPALLALVLVSALTAAVAQADVPGRIEAVVDADFYENGRYSKAMISLGEALFFDKILSGNRNIACSSCHDPRLGTSDRIALSIGEGGEGLGPERHVRPDQPVSDRVPRNSQALWFVGASEFKQLFHDGRVSHDQANNWESGFWSPAREQLPPGLDNVLAVQAMFPVTSAVEMAGQKGENAIATAVALDELAGPGGAWDLLAKRLQGIPEYVLMFRRAFEHIDTAQDISFVDAANAIAAYETVTFRADESPFDEFLRWGRSRAMSEAQKRGLALFYGKANCASCHSGKFQTDQKFHAIAMPQIGPGKNDGWDTGYWQATGYMARLEDHGRARETARGEDKFAFRTPTLRNVALTAPYGHAGAYSTLEEVVRHHADPLTSLYSYRTAQAPLPEVKNVIETTVSGSQLIYKPVNPARLADFERRDTWVMNSAAQRDAIARANEIDALELTERDIADLVAFMHALTDPRFLDPSHLVPRRVPSGLAIDHPQQKFAMNK